MNPNLMQGIALSGIVVILILASKIQPVKFTLRTMIPVSFLSLISLILVNLSVMVPLFGFPSLRFGFSQLPILLSGALFGPWWGALAGILEDLLELASGTIISPFFGFTLNKALLGFIPGLVFWGAKKLPWSVDKLVIGLAVLMVVGSALVLATTNSLIVGSSTITVGWDMKLILMALSILVFPMAWWVQTKLNIPIADKHQFALWVVIIALCELLINVILTATWLQTMYGIPFAVQVVIRLVKANFFIPINAILMALLTPIIKRVIRS
jgi:ECF transporter S component (folate family)